MVDYFRIAGWIKLWEILCDEVFEFLPIGVFIVENRYIGRGWRGSRLEDLCY